MDNSSIVPNNLQPAGLGLMARFSPRARALMMLSAAGVIAVVVMVPQGQLMLTGLGFLVVQILVGGGAILAAIGQLTGDESGRPRRR